MSTAISSPATDTEVFRHQAHIIHKVVHRNLERVTHDESLIQPQPAGNCINWVVGHLVRVYDNVLPLLGQQPALGKDALKRYDRGSSALQDPAEALPLSELIAAWDTACERIDAGLSMLTPEKLDAPPPFSPGKNPNETVRSLLATFFFHQAYHAGQLGILRRLAGKKGAIA